MHRAREIDPETDEPQVELVPHARPPLRGLRVVGPGRRERGYLEHVAALEALVEKARAGAAALERELELSALCERGTQRAADRLERERDRAQAAQNRLILALGGLQRENELLREQLALAAGKRAERAPELAAPTAASAAASDAARRAHTATDARAPRGHGGRGWLRFLRR